MLHISRKLRQPLLTGLVVLLVLIVAGAGIWRFTQRSDAQSRPAMSNVVRVSDVSVELPQGTNAASYGIAGRPSAVAAAQLKKLERQTALRALQQPIDFTSMRRVPAGTKLRYQVPKDLKTPVFGASYDTASKQWVPEPTTYDPRTGVAVATISHFSVHDILTWSRDRLTALLKGAFKNVFGPVWWDKPSPSCGPKNGIVMVYSSTEKSVLTCHEATITTSPGANSPGTVNITVRLTNNRHYPMSLIYPSGGTASTDDSGSFAARLGAALNQRVSMQRGTSRLLLAPGATATVKLTNVSPPFKDLAITTRLDPLAYWVGIAMTGLDELGAMAILAKDGLKSREEELLKALTTEKVLTRVQTELSQADLSPETLKTLGDIVMDALGVVVEQTTVNLVLAIPSLVVQLFDASLQTLQGLVDSAIGATYHHYTFDTFGPIWNPQLDLHKVDWQNATIPGGWFLGPNQVKLTNGEATGVPTHIQFMGADEAENVYGGDRVVYGDLDGDGLAEAGVEVWIDGGGTAASQRAQGWIIFRAGPNGPVATKVIVPRMQPGNTWSPNPRNAGHISYVSAIRILPGEVLAGELYYRPTDATCCPSGKATTTWTYTNGTLQAGRPVIRQ
jgi:hypothetical protein